MPIVCQGLSTTLTAAGAVSYSWTPSTGLSATTGSSVIANPTATTVYQVTGNNPGCPSVATITVNVGANPKVTVASQSDVSCNGLNDGAASVNTSGGAGGYIYSWSTNQTGNSISNLPAGTHTVTVRDNINCKGTAIVSITEPAPITSTVTSKTNVLCNGASTGAATIASGGGTGQRNYLWSNNQTTASISNLAAATYSVVITDDSGCTKLRTVTITEPPAITVNASASVIICPGESVNLTASASGGKGPYTYTWEPGSFNGDTYNVAPTSNTTYSLMVTDANSCTSGPYLITASLPSPLIATITGASEVCIGSNLILSSSVIGGGGVYSYSWSPGGSNASSITVSPTVLTTYSMIVTDNCSSTKSAVKTVSINALPIVTFSSDTTKGCSPLCVNFMNSTPNTSSVQWSFGDGNSSVDLSPQHCFTQTGSSGVGLVVKDTKGCSNSAINSNMITVYPQPTAQFSADPMDAATVNTLIEFTDQSLGATSWLWSFGDKGNTSSTDQNTSFTYSGSGTYSVQLLVGNAYGCMDSISRQIKINDDFVFYVANAISPNNDGQNDIFSPQTTKLNIVRYELFIYDRWGNLVFKTIDLNEGWNGNINNTGDPLPSGTYVWKIFTRDGSGGDKHYNGMVNVIR